MSMQNEGKDVNANSDDQGMRPGTGTAGSGSTADPGAVPQPTAGEGGQQAEMPPSETDDDQYDQGTVRRAP